MKTTRRGFVSSFSLGAAGMLGASVLPTSSSAQSTTQPRRLAGGRFDFDTPYDRTGSNCSRWDAPVRSYPPGVFKYGMGIASMDFPCAPCITEALAERIKHENWGYLDSTDDLRAGIVKWNGERHRIDLDPKSVVISDGVYPGVIAALRAIVPRGSKVLIQSPAYSGFYSMARGALVETVDSPLVKVNGRHQFDWADLEARMTPDVAALILCNPQNPTGTVWTEDELLRLGRLALDHDIVVLSDEIHSDIIRAGHRHTTFAALPDRAVVDNSLTFGAISKTFNMAAMKNAYFYSTNPRLLARVNQYHRAEVSTLGVVATVAAYNDGGEWFDQANAYIDSNHDLVEAFMREQMPTVGYTRNEGTFITFLDFSRVMAAIGEDALARYGRSTPEQNFQDWLTHASGVYLSPGSSYGTGGAGHMRFNVASSKTVLTGALEAMAAAIRKV